MNSMTMTKWIGRSLLGASLAMVLGSMSVGCGYSEEEYQAQVHARERAEADLKAEQAGRAKDKKDHDDAMSRNAELMKKLGVDLNNAKMNAENLEAAMRQYKDRADQLEAIERRFRDLKQRLDKLNSVGLKVVVRNNRMVIQLPGDVLFDSGRETLKKDGKDILLKVANIIKADPQLVSRDYEVAGDTDNQAYAHGPFKDNWGLSLMRAREVLVFLIDPKEGGLPLQHWSAAGFADTDPVAVNTTPQGRQKNRRCELIVLPSVEEMLDLKAITQ